MERKIIVTDEENCLLSEMVEVNVSKLRDMCDYYMKHSTTLCELVDCCEEFSLIANLHIRYEEDAYQERRKSLGL